MATYDVGYDANGNALDFTTHALAVSGASAGDTLRTWYANNARLRLWSAVINDTKGLTCIGQDLGRARRWPIISATAIGFSLTAGSALGAHSTFRNYIALGANNSGTVGMSVAFYGSGSANHGFYLENIVCLGGSYGIYVTSNNACKEAVVRNCFVFGAAIMGVYALAGAQTYAVTCEHLSVVGCSYPFNRSGNITLNVFNSIGIGSFAWNGTIGGSHNACVNTANVPATGRILLDWSTNHPHFWCDEISDFDVWWNYNITSASCLYHAGTNRGVTTDILGRERHATTPSIGSFEGQDIPTHPDADDVRASVAFILNDGSTRTGTYSPDFPDVGNVRDTDTVDGETGQLSSDKILKSNTSGDGAGNYNDDNLLPENVRKDVAFGISQVGTMTAPGVTPTPTGVTMTPAGNGLGMLINIAHAGGNYSDDAAALIFINDGGDKFFAAASPNNGQFVGAPASGMEYCVRVVEPENSVSARYPSTGYLTSPTYAANYPPDPADLLSGADCRVDGVLVEGALTLTDWEAARNTDMLAADVRYGLAYVSRGVSRVGELYAGGEEIATPNISVTVAGNTATFVISSGEDLATNKIFLRNINDSAWPTIPAATKTGNGEVVVSDLPAGAWWAKVESWAGNMHVASNGEPVFFVTGGSGKEYSRSRLGEEIDAESAELLRAFGEPVTYLRGTAAISIIGIRSEHTTAREQSDANISGATQWEIRADDLDFGGGPFAPKAGDQIIDARGDVWIVLPEPQADEEFIFWKIPTKRMEWA